MQEYLNSLSLIASQLEKVTKRPVAVIMPCKRLQKLRMLRHLQDYINELVDVYKSDMKHYGIT